MANLIFFNLCSLFSVLTALVFWFNRALHPSHLFYLSICLAVNPILGKYFAGTLNLRRLIGTTLLVILDTCLSIPIFVALIYFAAIHVHTIQWQLVLCHALVLSVLTIGPHHNHSLVKLLFEDKKTNRPIDSFMLLNIILVIASSWFTSFASGLDDSIQAAHYPVASCMGALLGSAAANFFSIAYHLFKQYNTVGVY